MPNLVFAVSFLPRFFLGTFLCVRTKVVILVILHFNGPAVLSSLPLR